MPAKGAVPTWLYHPEQGARIHELMPGAPLPKGWRDTPWAEEQNSEPAPKSRTNDALPGPDAKRGRVPNRSKDVRTKKE